MEKTPRLLVILTVLSLLLLAAAIYMVFVYAPIEAVMGLVQKVFYFHVSNAWGGMVAFIVAAVAGGVYLRTSDPKWDVIGLASVELEYRAKLTELAFATTTQRRLLADFLSKSAANPQSPHAEANDRVMRDLYAHIHGRQLPDRGDPWSQTSTERVNRAARRLLQQNTDHLRHRE